MINVKLPRTEIVEIEILQSELVNFITYKTSIFASIKSKDELFNTLLLVDTAQKLAFSFRSKIEKTHRGFAALTFTVTEAVVLLQVCNDDSTIRTDYERFTMRKYNAILDKALTDLT